MSESVDILVAAENKASPVFDRVGVDAERLGARIKTTGKTVKASTELVGTFANVLGGTQFGAFAGQLAQVTERVSAFSEVSKAGSIGAFALKAGLVAAAGVVTYEVAEVIASWWFEIDKATAKAELAEKAFAKMSAQLEKARDRRAAMEQEEFSLIRDPAERERAINQRASQLESQLADMRKREKELEEIARQKLDAYENSFKLPFQKVDASEDDYRIAQEQLEATQKNIEALELQADALREQTSARAKSIAAKKEENALADKSDSFVKGLREEIAMLKATEDERRALTAQREAPAQSGIAKQLLEERDALRSKAEQQRRAEQEADMARKKEEDAIKRIAELEEKRRVDLEARRIELQKGKEAAQAYRYEQEGLSRGTAQRLASEEEKVRRQEQAASRKVDNSPQQATQGRLLTLGISVDPSQKIVDAVNKQTQKLSELGTKLDSGFDKLYEEAKKKGVILKKVTVP